MEPAVQITNIAAIPPINPAPINAGIKGIKILAKILTLYSIYFVYVDFGIVVYVHAHVFCL